MCVCVARVRLLGGLGFWFLQKRCVWCSGVHESAVLMRPCEVLAAGVGYVLYSSSSRSMVVVTVVFVCDVGLVLGCWFLEPVQ